MRDCALISAKEPSLSSFVSRYEYEIICPDSSVVKQFTEKEETNIRQMIEDIKVIDKKTVRLILVDKESKKVRLSELLPEIFNVPCGELDITRLAMYGRNRLATSWKSRWSIPLEVITLQNADCKIHIANSRRV